MNRKQTVATYMEGFNESDHSKILNCLTDDVVWDMPGFFFHQGKEAFDKEIANDAFEGKPLTEVIRMIEEGDIVVAEGSVTFKVKDGPITKGLFCDVFHFDGQLICKLTTYMMFPK